MVEANEFPNAIGRDIRINGLTFHYPQGRSEHAALADICLQVRAGETLALVGPSGAGKSTLFDLLLHFYQPDSGTIHIDGTNSATVSLNALRNCFSLVPQNPALFHGTVADNIRYARPNASHADVEKAARIAHAHEFIEKLPEGYLTRLGDAGLGLSGGQKQRLAIARALLADAPILLLDEATSALDAESGEPDSASHAGAYLWQNHVGDCSQTGHRAGCRSHRRSGSGPFVGGGKP